MTDADARTVILLYLIAFLNGAVLMAVEILGSRVLSPWFGNTIFVWGSLIGVFMAGMAAGYYLGGWLGDRWVGRGPLVLFLLLPGLLLVLFAGVAGAFCQWLAALDYGPRAGPLLACLALFFVPAACAGAVSPALFVRFGHDPAAAGRRVGSLYAVATLGSILGTLGTSFYLILWLGTVSSLRLCGAVLLALAFLAAALRGRVT